MQAEWKSFPGEEDLKTAAKEFSDREYKLERTNKRLWEHQELAEKERKALDEVRIRVREICGKCYLSPRLDLFTQALLALHRYKEILSQLQVAHGKYQNSLQYIMSQRDYLEELELDLDDIRYEFNRICLKVREVEGFLASVQKQLELTDYEEIKERLDHCVERLGNFRENERPVSGIRRHFEKRRKYCRKKKEKMNSDKRNCLRKRKNIRMYLNRNISLGMQSEYLLLQRIWKIRRKDLQPVCRKFWKQEAERSVWKSSGSLSSEPRISAGLPDHTAVPV